MSEKEREAREGRIARDGLDDVEVLKVIDAQAGAGFPGASASWVADHSGLSDSRVKKSITRLLGRGEVVPVPPFEKPSGNGAMTKVEKGFGRPKEAQEPVTE